MATLSAVSPWGLVASDPAEAEVRLRTASGWRATPAGSALIPSLACADEAAARATRFEPNRARPARRPQDAGIAVAQLLDPLVALLIPAAAISVAIGDTVEGSTFANVVPNSTDLTARGSLGGRPIAPVVLAVRR
jgi:hypothetical protein